jgi:hypothetical protein
MKEVTKRNAIDPGKFKETLNALMMSTYLIFEIARDHELPPISEDGCRTYFEESGKTGFQVAGQFDRPEEFFQTLLDMIRVQFEPATYFTLLLNSNIVFMLENVPEHEFQLGYVSIVSADNQDFRDFWENRVRPHLNNCGYDMENVSSVFAVATTGKERYYNPEFILEIEEILPSMFQTDEVVEMIRSLLTSGNYSKKRNNYCGYCLDSALENRTRLSMWLFLPS